MTGAQLEAASKDASGAFRITGFQRPEDGAWDPNHPNDFYFVTTASFTPGVPGLLTQDEESSGVIDDWQTNGMH